MRVASRPFKFEVHFAREFYRIPHPRNLVEGVIAFIRVGDFANSAPNCCQSVRASAARAMELNATSFLANPRYYIVVQMRAGPRIELKVPGVVLGCAECSTL
jgi:hypothetical protein